MTEDSDEDQEDLKAPVPTETELLHIYRDFLYELYVAQSWTMDYDRLQLLFNRLGSWGWSHNWGNGELDNDDEVNRQVWKIKEFLETHTSRAYDPQKQLERHAKTLYTEAWNNLSVPEKDNWVFKAEQNIAAAKKKFGF